MNWILRRKKLFGLPKSQSSEGLNKSKPLNYELDFLL